MVEGFNIPLERRGHAVLVFLSICKRFDVAPGAVIAQQVKEVVRNIDFGCGQPSSPLCAGSHDLKHDSLSERSKLMLDLAEIASSLQSRMPQSDGQCGVELNGQVAHVSGHS